MALIEEGETFEVTFLPWDRDVGFPQRIVVDIERYSYEIVYRFNDYDNSFILTITREFDEQIWFHGKIVPLNNVYLKDPTTGLYHYALIPVEMNEENIAIALVAVETV